MLANQPRATRLALLLHFPLVSSSTWAFLQRVKRRHRTLLLLGALVLFAALAIFLPLILGGADIIFGKTRYTSICTHCGVQTADDFYFFFDAEVAHSEKILPVSRKTVLPNRDVSSCEHHDVMVGKRVFGICKDGTILDLRRGEPLGDPHFQIPEVRNAYLSLAQKSPDDAAHYIEELARSRYKGK